MIYILQFLSFFFGWSLGSLLAGNFKLISTVIASVIYVIVYNVAGIIIKEIKSKHKK